MKTRPRITIDGERCKGCELCMPVCPRQVLDLSKELNRQGIPFAVAVRPDACTGCLNCARICPDAAIEITYDDD